MTTINALIVDIKNKFVGAPEAAIKAILKEAEQNNELHSKLLELGAQQILRASLAHSRRVGNELNTGIVLPSAIRQETKKRFMDRYTLYGGLILLADATKRDLADSARAHDAQSNGHQAAAAFERSIGRRLPEGK